MRRLRIVLGLAAMLLVAAAVAGMAQPRLGHAADTTATKTITVVGTGTASTVPDRASFQFGVDSRGETARAALAKNATAMSAMIDALKNAGIAAADLQTSGVWLYPQTDSDGTVNGFEASNGVTATVDVAKAGPLVDAAVAAGATHVYGPNLLVPDQNALYNQALKAAFANAEQKAAALAAAAGLTLGGSHTISEGMSPGMVYPGAVNAGGGTTTGGSGAPTPTPIEPGMQSTQATVTVSYDAT